MEMETWLFQKKLSRDVLPPNVLNSNLKMCKALTNSGQGAGDDWICFLFWQ